MSRHGYGSGGGYGGYGGWAPYVSVAERRRKAATKMDALRKKGIDIQPVTIDGRKIASSFWGEAWCEHMESFSDFPLPRWLRRAWGWTVVVLLALMVLVLFLPYPASGRIAMSVHLVTSFICLILTSWFYLVRKKATLRLMMLEIGRAHV